MTNRQIIHSHTVNQNLFLPYIPLSLLGGFGLAGFGLLAGLTSVVVAVVEGASGTPPIPRRSPMAAGDVLSTRDALSLPGEKKKVIHSKISIFHLHFHIFHILEPN